MKLSYRIREIRQRQFAPWLIGLAALLVAVAVRYALGNRLAGSPFITLFSATAIATLFGGSRVGLTVLGLSLGAAWFLFVPPFWSFRFERPADAVALAIYAISGGVVVFCVSLLNEAIDEAHRLRERTATLFKELQHRVANNLTLVSAVLTMQSRAAGADTAAGRALIAARERLFTMGQVHRHLHDPAMIDQPIGSYLKLICDDLVRGSGLNVSCDVKADGTQLEQNDSITVALIVTELVTNSLKHAFSGRDAGRIEIQIEAVNGTQCVLRVRDDGPGVSASPQDNTGLGRGIVRSLSQQLNAEITTENSGGTVVAVKFPLTRVEPA